RICLHGPALWKAASTGDCRFVSRPASASISSPDVGGDAVLDEIDFFLLKGLKFGRKVLGSLEKRPEVARWVQGTIHQANRVGRQHRRGCSGPQFVAQRPRLA